MPEWVRDFLAVLNTAGMAWLMRANFTIKKKVNGTTEWLFRWGSQQRDTPPPWEPSQTSPGMPAYKPPEVKNGP